MGNLEAGCHYLTSLRFKWQLKTVHQYTLGFKGRVIGSGVIMSARFVGLKSTYSL